MGSFWHDGSVPSSPRTLFSGSTLLIVRGVLLWLVVPFATCVWLILAFRLRRRGVGLNRFLGWVDLNLIAALQRTVLRPSFALPARWIPWSEMAQVTHRLGWLDPA